MKTLFSIFFLTIFSLGFAQKAQVKGYVIDLETNKPIPYANILLVDTGIGSYSNLDGHFELTIPDISGLKIKISSIGFQTYLEEIRVLNLDSLIKFALTPAITELNEIVITTDRKKEKINAKRILSYAIDNIEKTRHKDILSLQTFYRQIHYINNKGETQFLKLREAAINISRSSEYDNIQFIEIRSSYDLRKKEWLSKSRYQGELSCESKKNNISQLLKLDYVYYSKPGKSEISVQDYLRWNTGLDANFLKNHKFKFDKFDLIDGDLVYIIKVLPNSSSPNYFKEFGRKTLIPLGRITIREKDWGILEVEYAYALNPVKKNKGNFYYQAAISFIQGDILYKDVAKYRDYEGKLVLSYLSRDSRDNCTGSTGIGNLLSNTVSSDRQLKGGEREAFSYYRVRHELFVNNIGKDTIQVEKGSDALLPTATLYNEEFWKTYNILSTNRLEQKYIIELESNVPLMEQFRLSGNH